jgi:hypothetical protein
MRAVRCTTVGPLDQRAGADMLAKGCSQAVPHCRVAVTACELNTVRCTAGGPLDRKEGHASYDRPHRRFVCFGAPVWVRALLRINSCLARM